MINESPDAIKEREDIDSPAYGDPDSVTFALFNNFYLYSFWPKCTHGHLFEYLVDYIKYEIPDPNLLYQHKDGSKKLEAKYMTQHVGELSKEEIDKIKYLNTNNIDRTPVLKRLPQVIQGRLWTNSKMISFWNDLVYIASRKKDILEFIKLIGGNPYQYQYEIKDKLYSYEDFSSGKYSDNLKFDPGAVHTLSPEKKGDALKQMGVQPKKPIPLQFRQIIQGEGVTFREFLESDIILNNIIHHPNVSIEKSPNLGETATWEYLNSNLDIKIIIYEDYLTNAYKNLSNFEFEKEFFHPDLGTIPHELLEGKLTELIMKKQFDLIPFKFRSSFVRRKKIFDQLLNKYNFNKNKINEYENIYSHFGGEVHDLIVESTPGYDEWIDYTYKKIFKF